MSNNDDETRYRDFLIRAFGSIDSNTQEEPIRFDEIASEQTKLRNIIKTLAYYSTEYNTQARPSELPADADRRNRFFDIEEEAEDSTQQEIRDEIEDFNSIGKRGFEKKTIEGLEIIYGSGEDQKQYTPIVQYLTYKDGGVEIKPTFSVKDGYVRQSYTNLLQ